MEAKRHILVITLLLSGLFSLIFGYMTISIAMKITSFDGTTDVSGMVLDNEMNPLMGVEVRIDSIVDMTDELGQFKLDEVNEGWNVIQFYKEGYVPYRFGMIVYPDDGRWHDKKGNSGQNVMFDPPIILRNERVLYRYDELGPETVSVSQASNDSSAGFFLTLNFIGYIPEYPITINITAEKDAVNITIPIRGTLSNVSMNLTEDFLDFDMNISGKDILDVGISEIDLGSKDMIINVSLIRYSFMEYDMEDNVAVNGILGYIYIALGIISIFGAYLSWRTNRWTLLLIVTILTFLGRGPFAFASINFNHLLSITAIIFIILCRKDMISRI